MRHSPPFSNLSGFTIFPPPPFQCIDPPPPQIQGAALAYIANTMSWLLASKIKIRNLLNVV